MQIPSSKIVNGHDLPYVITSEEIFALKSWLMKPYPGKGVTRSSWGGGNLVLLMVQGRDFFRGTFFKPLRNYGYLFHNF